jgi:hypothetical protein
MTEPPLSGALHDIVTSGLETTVVVGADGTAGIAEALINTSDDMAPRPIAFLA